MTPVKIKSISITDIGFVVFLKGEEEDRVLPIFIGPVEAQAISMILLKTASKRPMTHELLYNLLNETEFQVVKVEITEIKNETFYAKLYIQKKRYFLKQTDKSLLVIDSRPSDAIALALKSESPIFVADQLLKEHGVVMKNDEKTELPVDGKVVSDDVISKKANEQLGVYQKMLEDAVREDRFEDAARLRNQIEIMMGKLN